MNKLDMESLNIVDENIEKIGYLFPNVIVESEKGKAIDFDLLKQELSNVVVDGNKEKYQLTWTGKKESILMANTPINKTLRPIREKSVDFENTQNIYIEGDNLETLKILQESYLNKIKCIYIDPPYNTGNDFIYNDNFSKDVNNELKESGQMDTEGNVLVSNNQSNGRFHSDWLSMMYSRIKLSRNLLTEDGVIFISIDDNELSNLKKICDEIFGENNFSAQFMWTKTSTPPSLSYKCRKTIEYVLAYQKNSSYNKFFGSLLDGGDAPLINTGNPNKELIFPIKSTKITFIENGKIPKGVYDKIELLDDIIVENNYNVNEYRMIGGFKWTQDTLIDEISKNTYFLIKSNKMSIRFQRQTSDEAFKTPNNNLNLELNKDINIGTNETAVKELNEYGLGGIFDFPKPISLIKYLIDMVSHYDKDIIVLDFFSGSSTTADAVMKLNSEDNGNRKFIMVQIPEKINHPKFNTICDFGEERIKKAIEINKYSEGFRVYKVDSSNMKDVYYAPTDLKQSQLNMFESNVKEDRSAEDLLTQVILDLGLTLDLSIEEKKILNNNVYFVESNSLVACFDNTIDINIIDEICKCKPLKIVFKESSFKTDSDKINTFERIKKLSNETKINII